MALLSLFFTILLGTSLVKLACFYTHSDENKIDMDLSQMKSIAKYALQMINVDDQPAFIEEVLQPVNTNTEETLELTRQLKEAIDVIFTTLKEIKPLLQECQPKTPGDEKTTSSDEIQTLLHENAVVSDGKVVTLGETLPLSLDVKPLPSVELPTETNKEPSVMKTYAYEDLSIKLDGSRDLLDPFFVGSNLPTYPEGLHVHVEGSFLEKGKKISVKFAWIKPDEKIHCQSANYDYKLALNGKKSKVISTLPRMDIEQTRENTWLFTLNKVFTLDVSYKDNCFTAAYKNEDGNDSMKDCMESTRDGELYVCFLGFEHKSSDPMPLEFNDVTINYS